LWKNKNFLVKNVEFYQAIHETKATSPFFATPKLPIGHFSDISEILVFINMVVPIAF